MRDVFDVLKHDHNEVEAMFARLENTPSAVVHDEEQRRERADLVQRLIIEESKHEAVEEEYFWPAVRQFVTDGDELADHAVGQEQEAKKVLSRLESVSADAPEFEELVASFIKDAREHVAYEEGTVWPRLSAALSAEDAKELGDAIAEAKEKAPTRPHPHTPPKPAVLRTAGKAAAAADRVWDRVTGRGQTR